MADDLTTPDEGDIVEFPFETDSDISPEDRKEVIAQIDAVAQENRIKVTPDLLRVESGSSGAFFPIRPSNVSFPTPSKKSICSRR